MLAALLDGVEIRGFLNESILTAANVFLSDPKKIRSLFKYSGLEIACLASSIAMTGKKRADARLAAVFLDQEYDSENL